MLGDICVRVLFCHISPFSIFSFQGTMPLCGLKFRLYSHLSFAYRCCRLSSASTGVSISVIKGKVERPILWNEQREMRSTWRKIKIVYSEFKQQIVELYNAGGTSYPQLEREYGVNRSTLSNWVKQLSPLKYRRRKQSHSKSIRLSGKNPAVS